MNVEAYERILAKDVADFNEGRHHERQRTVKLIGELRGVYQGSWLVDAALDKLVLKIVEEPLADKREWERKQ